MLSLIESSSVPSVRALILWGHVVVRVIFRTGLFCSAIGLIPVCALAQTRPDAGVLQQEFERGRTPALPKRITPERPAEPAAIKSLIGATITVKEFRFAGNTRLSSEQLAPVVARFLGRSLDFNELEQVSVVVAQAYRAAGWIVRVYLPRQEILDGIVTLQILEAVFGGVRFEGETSVRTAPERLSRRIEATQEKGVLLNAEALDRALLLADDLPGIAVTGRLAEGQNEKETDLVLKFADEPLFNGEIGVDNSGGRPTGAERVTGNFYLNSPQGLGEQFIANLIHAQGNDYGRFALTLPVGYAGWRVGANASTLAYRLIAPEFSALDARGTSSTAGLEASYPLIRSRLRNLYLDLNYDSKRFDNQSSGATTTRYQIDAYSVGLNGNLFDNFGGGGASGASLTMVHGNVDLEGSPNQAADAITTQAAGGFTKLRYALSRQQVLTDFLSLYGALSGQAAAKNLDSAEKFYLGGASGVRAYPASEGGGTVGQLINLELRARLPQNFTLSAFYDWGRVTVNRNNDFTGAPTLNAYSLQGAGVSVGWVARSGLNLRATWARRIGDNPNPTATGNDQDGSLVRDRFWLTASLPF